MPNGCPEEERFIQFPWCNTYTHVHTGHYINGIPALDVQGCANSQRRYSSPHTCRTNQYGVQHMGHGHVGAVHSGHGQGESRARAGVQVALLRLDAQLVAM